MSDVTQMTEFLAISDDLIQHVTNKDNKNVFLETQQLLSRNETMLKELNEAILNFESYDDHQMVTGADSVRLSSKIQAIMWEVNQNVNDVCRLFQEVDLKESEENGKNQDQKSATETEIGQARSSDV